MLNRSKGPAGEILLSSSLLSFFEIRASLKKSRSALFFTPPPSPFVPIRRACLKNIQPSHLAGQTAEAKKGERSGMGFAKVINSKNK